MTETVVGSNLVALKVRFAAIFQKTNSVQLSHDLHVFRGQIDHYACSGETSLKRTTRKHSQALLEQFMPAVFHLVIEHGCHDDWPELCYPPMY